MLLSSLYLAGTIAEPVKRLAAAADRVRSGAGGRSDIPNFPERNDEIGDLADSLEIHDRPACMTASTPSKASPPTWRMSSRTPSPRWPARWRCFPAPRTMTNRARLLEIVRGDVKRIDRLITDISDASRLDAELSRETKEPVALSQAAGHHYRDLSHDRYPGGRWHSCCRDELPPGAVVNGRDERLGQVFRNLIDNAISFSPEQRQGDGHRAAGSDMIARVTVEDEGPGIPPDNLESIFERFYTERPGESFGRNSGLGLSIARQIIEAPAAASMRRTVAPATSRAKVRA